MVKVKCCVGSSACEVFPIKLYLTATCVCVHLMSSRVEWDCVMSVMNTFYTTDKEMSIDNEPPSSWIHFAQVSLECVMFALYLSILYSHSVQHESFQDAVYNKTVYSMFIKITVKWSDLILEALKAGPCLGQRSLQCQWRLHVIYSPRCEVNCQGVLYRHFVLCRGQPDSGESCIMLQSWPTRSLIAKFPQHSVVACSTQISCCRERTLQTRPWTSVCEPLMPDVVASKVQ